MKIVIKRLPDVHYIYSSICFGSEGFDFVVCDFRSGCLFFSQTERRCRCLNSLIDVSVDFALLFWAILDKIWVGRVRDVRHSYSDSFIGSKGFYFDVCDECVTQEEIEQTAMTSELFQLAF